MSPSRLFIILSPSLCLIFICLIPKGNNSNLINLSWYESFPLLQSCLSPFPEPFLILLLLLWTKMDGTAEAVLQPHNLRTAEKQVKARLNSGAALVRSAESPQEWMYSSSVRFLAKFSFLSIAQAVKNKSYWQQVVHTACCWSFVKYILSGNVDIGYARAGLSIVAKSRLNLSIQNCNAWPEEWYGHLRLLLRSKKKGQVIYYKLIRDMPFIPMACVTQCCLKQFRSSHSPYKDISLLLLLLNPSFWCINQYHKLIMHYSGCAAFHFHLILSCFGIMWKNK